MIATAEKPRTKRVRTFFKSGEIAHQWAHQLVPHGRCPGNMKFEGPAFYSYGTVIARILEDRGRKIYVRDAETFSPSTTRHQGEVRSSIPENAIVFRVLLGVRGQDLHFTPKSLRDYYLNEFRKKSDSPAAQVRARDLIYRVAALDDAIRVCDTFRLGSLRLRKMRIAIDPDLQSARMTLQRWNETREARAAKAAATRQANLLARAEAFIADPTNNEPLSWRDRWRLPSDVRARFDAALPAHEQERDRREVAELVRRAEAFIADPVHSTGIYGSHRLPDDVRARYEAAIAARDRLLIEAWLRGEPVRLGYDVPVYLRQGRSPINRDRLLETMETSKGVTVPLGDARRALAFVYRLRRAGKSWHRNGERCPIGQFELDAVNEQGVVAGCHRVTWAEIDRFAASIGMAPETAAVVT